MWVGLYRQINAAGHVCEVVSPAHAPRRSGDRVKTDRRDAILLARLGRAGELTAVWVPDEVHEAMRDLIRGRKVAVKDVRQTRQRIRSFLLRTIVDTAVPFGSEDVASPASPRWAAQLPGD